MISLVITNILEENIIKADFHNLTLYLIFSIVRAGKRRKVFPGTTPYQPRTQALFSTLLAGGRDPGHSIGNKQ